MAVLCHIQMDGTFNQTVPLARLVGAKHVFSVDLKSATDRWTLKIQISVFYECFGRRFSEAVEALLNGHPFLVDWVRRPRWVHFPMGQPLGYHRVIYILYLFVSLESRSAF